MDTTYLQRQLEPVLPLADRVSRRPQPAQAGKPREAIGLGRRTFLTTLSASAVLGAPPFFSNPPLVGGPPILDTTLPLVPPAYTGRRSVDWVAEMRVEWSTFASRYVERDGRVVDTANRGISHSEGQGAALLFAAEAGDLEAFERILHWTRRNLACRRDHLHAWRYRPDTATPVTDFNNATDGDILIAWALARAGHYFSKPEYVSLATRIASDIEEACTLRVGQRLVLLPGSYGFQRRDHVIINPSYYIYSALLDFERLVPGPQWRELVATGLDICCRSAVYGRWKLPADWIEVPRDASEPVRLALDWPARFSWDALRVPLNLAWGRRRGEPVLHASVAFWDDPAHRNRLPAWTDLRNDSLAPYEGHAGVRAVAQLARAMCRDRWDKPNLPRVTEASDYYGASLTLMARIACREAHTDV